MLRIAIIEDEDEQRAALCQALRNLAVAENWELNIRAFPDARSFFFARESEAFDLLLLDLILPGLSGLEIAERLRAEGDRVQLAFLSSERSAVFSGYKVGALDYLLKPWQEAELSQLLQRARAVLAEEPAQLELYTEQGLRSMDMARWLALEVRNKVLVFYFQSADKGLEELQLRESLEHMEEKLNAIAGLAVARPHRSYLCNLRAVRRVGREQLELESGLLLPLARARRETFMQAYLAFCRERRGATRRYDQLPAPVSAPAVSDLSFGPYQPGPAEESGLSRFVYSVGRFGLLCGGALDPAGTGFAAGTAVRFIL